MRGPVSVGSASYLSCRSKASSRCLFSSPSSFYASSQSAATLGSSLRVVFPQRALLPSSPLSRGMKSLQYHHPYRLSPVQRAFLFPYFGGSVLMDPRKGEILAALGDMTSKGRLAHIRNRLMDTAEGRLLLSEKPLISESALTPFTDGYARTKFLLSNHLDLAGDG